MSARDRESELARQLSPQAWRELAETGRSMRRRLAVLHEQLQPLVGSLGDEHVELRDQLRRGVLPSVQSDIDELKYDIRRAELYAEYSAQRDQNRPNNGAGSKKSREG